ncbi:MAG TPA: DMT family transporter [Bacteroidales bacterium]|nr:DMT family transporter [Bacteroidales bacterium]
MPGAASKNIVYHALAFLTVSVWGATFISTKVLINNGLSPAEIMFLRFAIAYICLWAFTYKQLFAQTLKDEFLFLLSGMSGGSLYFMAENTALSYSLASNVSLLVCTAPIFTALLYFLTHRNEKLRFRLIYGSLLAFSGVALVIYSGGFILKINPLGDFLALMAALSWAFYSMISKGLISRYSSWFVTRKVFFYGLLTILPFLLNQPSHPNWSLLLKTNVLLNLLFLSLIASMLGYIFWSLATRRLGIVRVTTYIYFCPVITLLTANLMLHEHLTLPAMIGAGLIVGGVYLAEKGFQFSIRLHNSHSNTK